MLTTQKLKKSKQKLKQMKIDRTFIALLVLELERNGISPFNIECILQYGSSTYVRKPDDYDFKVIVKKHSEHTHNLLDTTILDIKVQCVFYSLKDWNNILNERAQCVVAESTEMICVYGDDSNFKRYNIVEDKDAQKYVLSIYDEFFFNCKDQDFYLGDKRLWNFLVFAFKLKNKSNLLTKHQLSLINKAHDLKLNKEKFRPLFNSLKEEIL